jgi:VWFA-related protein
VVTEAFYGGPGQIRPGFEVSSAAAGVTSEASEVASEMAEVASEASEVTSDASEVTSEVAEVASEVAEMASVASEVISATSEVTSEAAEVPSSGGQLYNHIMRYEAAALLLTGLLLVPAAGTAQEPPEETFGESITVALDTLTVRVVDNAGRPIPDLGPEDFLVRIRGREVPVTAVDWVASGITTRIQAETLPLESEPLPPSEPPAEPEGKLIVFFVQADLNPTRISGQMRLRPYTRELLATLHPADRIAVVSYDSHLKLWLDFTGDHEAVHKAVDRAQIFARPPSLRPQAAPSLAAFFDPAEGRRVASPEKALEVTAQALSRLPGEKTMVYLGWGLGRFGVGGVRMTPDYKPAVRALHAARVSVFVLDVTSADYHSLEVGLQSVAAATGGTYASTFRLPNVATDRIAQAISGHYVLTFDRQALAAAGGGRLEVKLRGRRGEVLVRSISVR